MKVYHAWKRYNEAMSHYDQFARFYDTVMGDRSDVIEILSGAITRYQPQGNSLLELGCGTGSIMAGFADQFELHGIDQSANMLQIAQHKLSTATLHQGTIAGFELHQQFDVIICVFDTLNHLTDFADWQKLFASAKKHLCSNGLFIFDMNTIGRLQALSAIPSYVQTFDTGSMEMIIEPVAANEVIWNVTIQVPESDGAIQVYQERVHEASFPIDQVSAQLETSFEILERFDSDHQPPTDSSDRVYFICR
jgi:SAM-dependent methyltransferase